jgi:hypothetical protein
MPASCSDLARTTRTRRQVRPRRQSCFSSTASQTPNGYGKLQMELEWLKEISAALMPVNFADLSMANILSSVSAANVSYGPTTINSVLPPGPGT